MTDENKSAFLTFLFCIALDLGYLCRRFEMEIQEVLNLYAKSPQSAALAKLLCDKSASTAYIDGATASIVPVMFASVARSAGRLCLFVLDDAEEAGYFYHDLTQMLGNSDVLFFPSSYRRQVKYGQRDSANEILRTEVLGRVMRTPSNSTEAEDDGALYIVTCPEALGELVVSRRRMDEHTVSMRTGEAHDITQLCKQLRSLGFTEVDYVYEPGQFALRGSILDVFSFSSEYPFRVDFFGDTIDSIRTFEVQSQLSCDKRDAVEIVPELATHADEKVPFLSFLPSDAVLVVKDFLFCREKIDGIFRDGFSSQAVKEKLEGLTEMEQQAAIKELQAGNMLHLCTHFKSDEQLSADQIDILAKTLHPSPAVCGIPKKNTMQIIVETEAQDRKYYTGYLGPLSASGGFDLFMNLRSMEIFDDALKLFVGSDITPDSDPERKWQETNEKANTILNLIRQINYGKTNF